jgi:hypothetical protein
LRRFEALWFRVARRTDSCFISFATTAAREDL